MKLKLVAIFFSIFSFWNCYTPKIPAESITLIDYIQKNGNHLFFIQSQYIHAIFENKKNALDSFIKNTYTPKYIKNNIELVTDKSVIINNIDNFLAHISQDLLAKRQELFAPLDSAYNSIIQHIQQEQMYYNLACQHLRNLQLSAIKLNQQMELLKNKFDPQNQLDFNKIQTEIDLFSNVVIKQSNEVYPLLKNINTIIQKN